MSVFDIVVILIVASLVVAGLVRTVGSATGKRDCCSGSKTSCSCHQHKANSVQH